MDLSKVNFEHTSEKLVDILCRKTQNDNPLFFRVLVAYYFCKVASMMRVNIATHDRGIIPVNMYAINLASSGQGKGHSTNIIEEQVINQFRDRFMEETFPVVSENKLYKLSVSRATRKSCDPDEELVRVNKEFQDLGELAFSFDSGTTAAIKQMRHKLLMSEAGSMNLEIDEIGSNFTSNVDMLTAGLELYDVGKIKQKLTKNTAENKRSEEINGRTPMNMMLFGTPSKLLNGSKVEDEFIEMLETGYGRRSFFGFVKDSTQGSPMTAQERYDRLTDNSTSGFLEDLSDKLGELADGINFNKTLTISKDVSLMLIQYQIDCEKRASKLAEHEDILRAEITHRYFKSLKLAGAYAFVNGEHEITEEALLSAIKLAEISGEALQLLMTRDRNYVKLAKYISTVDREVTHVDMTEDLPFYKGSESAKRELMNLAIAYGYKNNIIIKKYFQDGIEFLKGESLKETDLDNLILSYSTSLATDYRSEYVPWDRLHELMQLPNYHWVAHHLTGGHRKEEKAIPGFNMVVIDVDGGVSMDTARLLLADYKFMMYSTKRSTATKNRFRLILPISHTLEMDAADYKDFMRNVYEWLPFSSDEQTDQRARKWQTHNGHHEYNEGKLLDALNFIPKTRKNEERKKLVDSQQSLDNVERWFINNTGAGNRSNQLIKFALLLVDSGQSEDMVRNAVLQLNSKLPDKLDEQEILSTIMVTAAKAIYRKEAEA